MTKVLDRENIEAHAKLSPSSSDRWIACPGSVQAQAELFDPSEDDSNPDSRLGTAAHALLEACLLVGCEPEAMMGCYLAGKDHPPVDEDMCDWVRIALDYIQEYIDTYGEENLWVLPESRVYIGPQIDITGDDEKDALLCNGTSDVIIAHRDMSLCVSIDYKNGVRKVVAKENPQIMLYTAGARQLFGVFKRYRAVVIQPRAGKRSPVEEWEYTDGTLRKFLKLKVQPSARAALRPDAPRVAGDHCLYCKAAPRCRTRKNKVMAVAGVEFDAIEEEPDPNTLTNEEFLRVLDNLNFLESYIHSVRGHALRMVEHDPRSLPGWKLGWTKRQREWDDEGKVIEYCQRLKLPPEDYMPRGLLSPAQLQKVLRKRKIIPRRKAGAEPPPNPLDAFIRYSIPRAALVRAEEEFDPIDGE